MVNQNAKNRHITTNMNNGTIDASQTYLVKSAAAFMTAIARVILLIKQTKIKRDKASNPHTA